jgi:chemotaxis protein methyltransferase CheR
MNTTHETLSPSDFARLRAFIHAESGIHLSSEKKTMLEIRLRRRLHSLHLSSCAEYCNYLFAPDTGHQEIVHLIDSVTTNKTDFFREPDHFDFLVSQALPSLDAQNGMTRRSLIWNAGCSTGEEPYTLAMVLSEYAQLHSGFHFSLLATDICTTVLDKARVGIFKTDAIRPVPQSFRKKYLMRNRDPGSELVRIVPELRANIEFGRRPPPVRAPRNHLLSQRHHLFRPADPDTASRKAHTTSRARRLFLCGPLRIPAKYGPASGLSRPCSL